MEPAFFVSEFSSDILSTLIKQCFGADFNDVVSKPQVKNIIRSLEGLGAKAIICEREYIDKDFSDDYANYYVQAFKDYRGSCARLHFFSQTLTQEDFTLILTNDDPQESGATQLNHNYLGFMVIKPLPFTFLGRVCIKSSLLGCVSRTYHANLFGIQLSIKSIAFQEQDRGVSACATTSVWSLLHALPDIHNKSIPSPSAITLAALGSPLQYINSFPNKGLNLQQITTALESLKLRQHSFSISDFDEDESRFLRKFIECYVNSKIPVFLGAQIYKRASLKNGKPNIGSTYALHGDHAVVVVGIIKNSSGYILIVHDDRIGPFIQLKLTSVKKNLLKGYVSTRDGNRRSSTQSWAFEIAGEDELLVPKAVLVATYSKKKIAATSIIETAKLLLDMYSNRKTVSEEDRFFAKNLRSTSLLYECHNLKIEYLKTKKSNGIKCALVSHLPHFIWRIRYELFGEPIIDFLFDATDTPNGAPYLQYVTLDDDLGTYFISGLKDVATALRRKEVVDEFWGIVNDKEISNFHFDVLRKIEPTSPSHKEFLSSRYGELRSPYYLKDTIFNKYPIHIVPGDIGERCRLFSEDDANKFNLDLNKFVVSCQAKNVNAPAIWVIDEDGALIIGPDNGHPNLTGANPARIAGEIQYSIESNSFIINAKSGRYSKQYQKDSIPHFLEGARLLWKMIFPKENFQEIYNCPNIRKDGNAAI